MNAPHGTKVSHDLACNTVCGTQLCSLVSSEAKQVQRAQGPEACCVVCMARASEMPDTKTKCILELASMLFPQVKGKWSLPLVEHETWTAGPVPGPGPT